jgi:hypothetical protein
MRSHLRVVLPLLGALISTPAAAQDFCTEAWVVRNMIFDRLGHCFGSVTGQMLFDNSNCTISGPTPPRSWPRTSPGSARAKTMSGAASTHRGRRRPRCTNCMRIFALHRPACPDYIGGYACWGYRGPDFRLLSGARVTRPRVGIARTGQSVVTEHWGRPGGWVYGSILTGPGGRGPDPRLVHRRRYQQRNCDLVAG